MAIVPAVAARGAIGVADFDGQRWKFPYEIGPMTDRLVCMETCEELTAANNPLAVNTDPLPRNEARGLYMREYMRKRRAAAKTSQSRPMTREFQTLSPTMQTAITIDEIDKAELDFAASGLDLDGLADELVKGLKRFHFGDIRGVENGLLSQANTLNQIFHIFTRRGCREGSWEYREMEFRIAFRAQSQYRATLATLAAVKNPARVAIVNQANIAHGPQQINNGGPAHDRRRSRRTDEAAKQTISGEP
jgi:hypothetical protein